MKKRLLMVILLVAVAFGAVIWSGCSSGSSSGGGEVTTNMNVLLSAVTARNPSSSADTFNFMRSSVASNSLIQALNPKTLRFPNGKSYSYTTTGGSVNCNNYYFGNSTSNYGPIADPFSETAQRQLNLDLEYTAPLDGDYKVTLDTITDVFEYQITDYMDEINENNVQYASGNNYISMGGDTIVLGGQNNNNYRYFCRIYNNQTSPGVYANYWTSVDVRSIDWTSQSILSDFILNRTVAPVGGVVNFEVPGGILEADPTNTVLVIWAFQTDLVYTNEDGFKTFCYAVSELKMPVEVR